MFVFYKYGEKECLFKCLIQIVRNIVISIYIYTCTEFVCVLCERIQMSYNS